MDNGNVAFDVRRIPTKGLLDNSFSNDSESFIHKKYNEGRPNGSLDATEEGFKKSLDIMLNGKPYVFFGSHIRETIRQWRLLFGKN